MTKLKFCGLRRACDIEYANALNPDYIGFVFYKKSRRYVGMNTALRLRQKLSENIIPVGVFVDEDPKVILKYIQNGIISAVQLHGSEDEEYIIRLKNHTNVPIIKAFILKELKDISHANKSYADHILLDSGRGSGISFDHSILSGIRRPYFLAGGLTPQTIPNILTSLHPYAIDLSTSIETSGFKDFDKMHQIKSLLSNQL